MLRQYYSIQKSFQNDRFVRSSLQILQKRVPKRAFRAKLEAPYNFHRRRFQNDRFVRGFFEILQKKVPKRAFRAKLPTIFREEGFKMIVLREASSKFHKRRFQNERLARGLFKISQKKLPKRAFRAKLEASYNFHRRKFQNDRFVRGFLQYRRSFQNDRFVRGISKKKLPKGSFCARLPPNFIEQSFQNDRFARGPSNFHRTMLPKHNRSQPEANAGNNSKSSKFAFRHSFVQSAHRILREGSSSKI